MPAIDLKSLIAKLNPICRRTLEGAAGLCLSRTNYNIELEHWLLKLLEVEHTDLLAILQHFEIDPSQLQTQLMKSVDKFKTGNARPPALSQSVVDVAKNAWLVASIDHNQPAVRSGFVLAALMADETIWRTMSTQIDVLNNVSLEILKRDYVKICSDTAEDAVATSAAASGAGGAAAPGSPSTQALDQFTVDLTARAKDGKIDPVLGRDEEIRQIVDILMRRRQNNPILTGEAGVGKTAVVEGFALRLVEGDVPDAIKNVSVRSLDLALLQAGAGVKGEFENRLKSVLEEVWASPKPIVLFIDEAHTLIGAGGQAGQGDAANLLKPALARGELRTIAATTWAEYKKYFERDAALARRFQVVKVEEPDEEKAINMMRGLVDMLEGHHEVRILNEAVEDAVKLSSRYISGRQLPDKAVSLLDTTCARIALSQNAKPPEIEDSERRLENLKRSKSILKRESVAGVDFSSRIAEIDAEIDSTTEKLADLETRWEKEQELAEVIRDLRTQIDEDTARQVAEAEAAEAAEAGEAGAGEEAAALDQAADAAEPSEPFDREATEAKLESVQTELAELAGETPLVHPYCDSGAVAATVASWTGIPVGRMVSDEIQTILHLQDRMEESVVGQSHAMKQIAESIQTSRAGLTDPSRPIGVFFLAGTSGVGKTETALTLAELLYGGEQNMTVLNMSEFKEEHKVSLLMGSPPGYVGYGEGGVLTEAVRRKPYSVVLLDEMEKAHAGVQDIFYQVFDKGHMKDGEGRDINFRNTVIIMTSNAGTDLIKGLCSDPETIPDPESFVTAIYPELLKTFKPAFLGRVSILPYYPLSDDVMKNIARLKLRKVEKRIKETYRAAFGYTEDVIDVIQSRCTEVDTGARNVDKILNKTLLPTLSARCLAFLSEGKEVGGITIGIDDSGDFSYEIQERTN